MLQIPSVTFTRRAIVAVIAISLIVFPLAANAGQTNEAGFLILVTIVILSLVVLTGWAGQASLGQFGFAAVAAVVGGALTTRTGIPFWVALVLVPFFTAALSSLMGFPALRIRGLFLAVATFGFAIAVESALFQEQYFSWLLPGDIERPKLFFIDLEDTRSMYYFNLVALAFAIFIIVVLRRSRTGRVLIALRENENNLRSFGVNPMRMRLLAFAISGFLCGLAGFLLAHHQRAATAPDFPAFLSLQVFLFAVVGGVGSVTGALLGALYFSLQRLISNEFWAIVVGPFGVLIVLYVAPGGLASVVTSLRDGVLKIVAQRRQMVVPSLFADIDPAVVEGQLIPLSEPLPEEGLGALPQGRAYRSGSDLYGERGRPSADGERMKGEEAAALGAAVEALGGED
jgi:branched-chain amino acid transport system permease protein